MNESSNSNPVKINEISDEDEKLLNLQLTPKKITESIEKQAIETVKSKIEKPVSLAEIKQTDINDSEYLIYYPPRYTLPPYKDSKFAPLSFRDQVKLICCYHTLISRTIANQAKIQIDSCSYPEPIEPDTKKYVSLAQKKDLENEESKQADGSGDKSDEYVSRAGRITKRKFYSEVDDLKKDSVVSPKGIGEDEVSTKRKAPPPPSRNRNLRQKQLKLDSSEAEIESKKKINLKTLSPSTTARQQKKSSDGFLEPVAPSSNKRTTRKTIECPICGKHFPEKEIEQHASSCGEIAMDVCSTNHLNFKSYHCNSCKKVLLSEEDYEIHCTTCNGGPSPSYLN